MPSLLDPNDELVSPEERKQIQMQNLFGGLLQAGLQTLAAGENLYPWQRAQMLGQVGQTIGQMPGNIREGMQNAAQQKLLQQKYNEKKQQAAADAELMKIGENPAFLETLKQMPPDLQSVVPALFKSGRARDAVTLVDNWRTNQQREQAARLAADRPPEGFQWNADRTGHVPIPGGMRDPKYIQETNEAKRQLKVIPSTENDKLATGGSSLMNIDRTMETLAAAGEGNKPSMTAADWVAKVPFAGDKAANIINPSGAMFRAAIADVSSALLQARSGLAVTAAEYQRMAAKLPDATEDPKIIQQKLAAVRQEMAQILAGQSAQYSEKNGYVPHEYNYLWNGGARPQQAPAGQKGGDGQADVPPVPGARKAPDGHYYIQQNGKYFRVDQ